ncbi:EAL domain-containing protein [Chromobacterium sp. IIBBL 290-4]|uniref:EAL domain-containing protein n=1 Tax=Chromobacterium sp. IIBBL 290-4 TaxID=2953890 RepID=UPI0020B65782|nr:EAL domain-containing protein [Chromobacterium sp. IIBBL 290-4]UTH74093.1 EAL domain-containing protein [Chromobacterium sp. IIBBL 290-4]
MREAAPLPDLTMLSSALRAGEFRMCYQPQLCCRSLRVVGAEALMRWNSSVVGRAVSPAEFIPQAERNGFIVELGGWSMSAALRELLRWRRAVSLESGFRLAINLSGRQMTAGLPSKVAALLEEVEVAPEWVELEITESYSHQDIGLMANVASRLRDMGLGIAIDDFGTRFSVMEYLRRMPATRIKIDGSLTRQILVSPRDYSIMRNLIRMIGELGMESVCEGVETAEQLAAIQDMGADCWQGFLFSPGVTGEAFQSLLGDARQQ